MKKNGLKIALTIVAILIALLVWFNYSKVDSQEGTITVIVMGVSEEEVVRKKVEFFEKEALADVLMREFEVLIEKGMLLEIEGVAADNQEYFLKILINGKAANYGVKQIELHDQDTIVIAYTKVHR